jgi:hypothetical protein
MLRTSKGGGPGDCAGTPGVLLSTWGCLLSPADTDHLETGSLDVVSFSRIFRVLVSSLQVSS